MGRINMHNFMLLEFSTLSAQELFLHFPSVGVSYVLIHPFCPLFTQV